MGNKKKHDKGRRKDRQVVASNVASQPVQVEDRIVDDSSNIIRHGAGKLETFELKESELEKIENDTWGGRFFDLAINCFTLGATTGTSLVASKEMDETVKVIFSSLFVICIIGLFVFSYLAFSRSKARRELFRMIRER